MTTLKRLRGPIHYARNIAVACWRFHLRDMADRPGQTTAKRIAYRLVISIETLLEAAALALMLVAAGTVATLYLPTRWAWTELRDTWGTTP